MLVTLVCFLQLKTKQKKQQQRKKKKKRWQRAYAGLLRDWASNCHCSTRGFPPKSLFFFCFKSALFALYENGLYWHVFRYVFHLCKWEIKVEEVAIDDGLAQ